MKVLLGTTNPSKVKRFADLLKGYDIEFITLRDIEVIEEPKEMGNTPEETGIYVVSDKGTRYEIVGKGDVINTIEPKNQGLQTIIIYRQNEDGTWNYKNNVFRVGSELD